MAQKTRSADRDSATELELYLPAGVASPSESSWVDRLWAKLFNHHV